jgi:hypothetical protein
VVRYGRASGAIEDATSWVGNRIYPRPKDAECTEHQLRGRMLKETPEKANQRGGSRDRVNGRRAAPAGAPEDAGGIFPAQQMPNILLVPLVPAQPNRMPWEGRIPTLGASSHFRQTLIATNSALLPNRRFRRASLCTSISTPLWPAHRGGEFLSPRNLIYVPRFLNTTFGDERFDLTQGQTFRKPLH